MNMLVSALLQIGGHSKLGWHGLRLSQGAESPAVELRLDIEVILAVAVDMGITCRGQAREVGGFGTIPIRPHLVDDRLRVDRVPHNHRVGDQVQTSRLMRLLLSLFPSDDAFIGERGKAAQGMERFSFVEMSVNAALVGFTRQIP
jgi:hypothetical protein